MKLPTRRGVLRGLMMTATAVLTGPCLPWLAPRAAAERFLTAIARLIPIPELKEVGRLYLVSFPDEARPEQLVASLFGDIGSEVEQGAKFLDRCQERFRSEFERGETLTVDGWLISRSEARFCALIYLGQQEVKS